MDQFTGEVAPVVPDLVVLVARHREKSGCDPLVLDARRRMFLCEKGSRRIVRDVGYRLYRQGGLAVSAPECPPVAVGPTYLFGED